MRSWWGEGVGSSIASPMVAVDIRPAYFHAVVDVVAGVACAGPLSGSRLVDTVPLCWVLIRCRGPCHVPFFEKVGCWVAEGRCKFYTSTTHKKSRQKMLHHDLPQGEAERTGMQGWPYLPIQTL